LDNNAIAVVQLTATPGRALENRARTVAAISAATDRGARIIVLPELVTSGYCLDRELLDMAAEELDGPTLEAWTKEAARLNVVIAGGFCEKADGKLYNSALLVGPDGLLLHYRKLHLFDREKLIFAPGDVGLGVVETPFGRVGLCVCYDLRFVEVMRALALQGADVIAVPTAWVGGFDKVQRDGDGLIGQARGAIVQANLNQVYVACASQCGQANDIRFLGSSLIADPYGHVLSGPLDSVTESTSIASFNRSIVQEAQNRSDLIRPRADRRDDVYELTLKARPS
jgi:predicted amidohydrolase